MDYGGIVLTPWRGRGIVWVEVLMDQMPTDTVALLGLAIGTDAILVQERAGQAALTNAANIELPTEIYEDGRAILSRMGVIFGERVRDDKLFQNATLPTGWSIKPTDHSMWSHLVDAHGAKRAAIFYKAAFYDRAAHMRVLSRYVVDEQYPCPPVGEPRTATVTDAETGEVICTVSEVVPKDTWDSNPRALCVAWLDEHRPGHKFNKGWTLPT